MEHKETYVTPEHIANTFHVPVNRVHYWLREGRLKGIKIGKVWRVAESALDSFVEASSKSAASE